MHAEVVIVGLGQIGMGYDLNLDPARYTYSHARAFSRHPSFKLVAGVDTQAQRREIFEQAYRLPAYPDTDTALQNHQPDLVIVAVPTAFHSETVQNVVGRCRPKMILCEKPLSYDLNDARRILELSAENDVALYVNYMRRSDPGAIEIGRRIESGEFGSNSKGVAWYSKGFIHNGSHLFNLLESWLGPMRSSLVLDRGRDWNAADPEPDVRVAFERGSVVFLSAWEEAFSHYTIELLSPNGRLRYEDGGDIIKWQPRVDDPRFEGYSGLSAEAETIFSGMDRYQWHVAEQLARALQGQDAHLCGANDALHTLESMMKVLKWT